MRAVRACCAAVALLLSRPALAAPVGPATAPAADREAARSLAKRGYELFEEGSYARAIELFQQAEARIHAPPHWLYIARSQAKLGKLLQAKLSYERILGEKLDAGAPAPFKEAQVSAKGELQEIEVLVPSMEIALEGPGAASAIVKVDGEPFARADLGRAVQFDPGPHAIVVEVPGAPPVERSVTLKPGGDVEKVAIPVEAARGRSAAPAIVAFTLGGLAIGAGGATLGLYLSQKAPRSKGMEIASIASFAAGGVGVGTGILLLALRPAAPVAASARGGKITVGVGMGSVSLGGEF